MLEIFIKSTSSQGYNARKVISEVYASFVSSVLSLGGNVNTRQMSKPDIWSIFHIKNQWNTLVRGNYYVNYPNFQNLMLLRRVHATAINFPCITTLHLPNSTCTQVHLYFITYNSIRKPMDLILSPSLQQGVSGRRIVNGRSVSARIMCGQFKGIVKKLEDTYRVNQKNSNFLVLLS